MTLRRFASFSTALPPRSGGLAAASWDTPIPTSRTPSRNLSSTWFGRCPSIVSKRTCRTMLKIALRVAIAERSKDRARIEHLRLFHQSRESRPASLDPAGIVADVECSWLVHLIVRKLKRSQTEAVLLRFFLGCSVEEIASITGVPLNTAKTRLRTGKDKLRRCLEKRGYSPRLRGCFDESLLAP